jgi:N-acetylmuramic acid 6-phosphate etherase
LSRAVDYPMEPAPGPEIVTGSTRLRAGTATKMVLNMISTAVMVRLGYVYGNLMVNVQPTNQKLEDRARRIIAEAAGRIVPAGRGIVGRDRKRALRERAGRDRDGQEKCPREEAERLLAAAGGRIREVVD